MGSIANAINHRIDGVKYPINPPDGWVFMAFALDLFGPSALELGGSYRDFAWASEPDFDPSDRMGQWNHDHQKLARRRLPKLVRAFNSVMTSGEVKSGYSTIGGGAITLMPPEWWRTDDPMLRYRTFSIDPADPFSDRLSLPCWIWIEDNGLRRAGDRLYRERKGWGPMPEPPPLPRTEQYLRDDGQVETWSFDHNGAASIAVSSPQPPTKAGRPSMTTRIHKLFADHLRAGSVAERVAWEGEAIRREYGGDKPPKAETCADRIRKFYNMIVRDNEGRVLNAGAVLDAMSYPINPDKWLSSQIK